MYNHKIEYGIDIRYSTCAMYYPLYTNYRRVGLRCGAHVFLTQLTQIMDHLASYNVRKLTLITIRNRD